MAITGFVLGIVSGACIIIFGGLAPMLGLCISVPAIVFSAIGLKSEDKKQMCVCGISFGIIASIFFLVIFCENLLALLQLFLELTKI